MKIVAAMQELTTARVLGDDDRLIRRNGVLGVKSFLLMELALGSLILFSPRIDAMLSFYRTLGVPLELESHDEGGPIHYATELEGVHVAAYQAPDEAAAKWR